MLEIHDFLVSSSNSMGILRELFTNHLEAALKITLFHCEPEMSLSQRRVNVISDTCGILLFF